MPTFPVILDYYKEMNDIYIYIFVVLNTYLV